MAILAPPRLTAPSQPDAAPAPPRRRPGRSRKTPEVRAALRRANGNLDLQARVMDLERDAHAEPDIAAWCELGRPLLRAYQRWLEWELEIADGRVAA